MSQPLPRSTARYVTAMADTSRSVNTASGLLYRNMTRAIGVMAKAPAASNPAAGPFHRFTVPYRMPTDATPAIACGRRMLHEDRPKARTDRPVTHSDTGGLSTEMNEAVSKDPNSHAVQSIEPL